ncbi:hypothetical protein HN832_02325 [archaeon]|jgi:hypothetical protein|nr:hypothetical protein [archaeon]MBT4373190.1 hypothetical protein [archaeon]MBT4531535.1 hypothetical protein [archaeon]MBT7001287.1 hypothetical protein [archaeon]MBT7282227.1 hypothetical protein [archaeon]
MANPSKVSFIIGAIILLSGFLFQSSASANLIVQIYSKWIFALGGLFILIGLLNLALGK